MFDILKVLSTHTFFLENNLKLIELNQRKNIGLSFAKFYFLLPNVSECLEEHLKIKVSEEQFIAALRNDNLQYFKDALHKYDTETDSYSEDFIELEPMEINILSGLENCVYSFEKPQTAISNFLLIIDVLDYYENFSDNPKYWNKLLEQEIKSQQEIVQGMVNGEIMNENIYIDRYKEVPFDKI